MATWTISPAVKAITSNPVRSRDDTVNLLADLLAPLAGSLSPGGARVKIAEGGAAFDDVAAQLEGYARALWGLAPALAVDPAHPVLRPMGDRWRAGLDHGTNPDHAEFWGWPVAADQRFVEMCGIAVALALVPDVFWKPLEPAAQARVATWLLTINEHDMHVNNWRYFRVLVNVSLKTLGARYSQESIDKSLDVIETFYSEEHGFPADGASPECRAFDYYATSFAIPFYSLLYTRLQPEDTGRVNKAFARTRANIPNVIHLFAPDGSMIPFGRSMTYRFACAAFWSALAYATDDAHPLPAPLTWGVLKGLVLRSIRAFSQKESVFARDGSLTIGWDYPSLFMSEAYNSPQSPYWALKTMFVLALPEDHPFWAADEAPLPAEMHRGGAVVPAWGQTFSHACGHTFMLSAGQYTPYPHRGTAAKYGKMAYSAAFGFSVPAGQQGLDSAAPDSTLALSDDAEGEYWRVPRIVEDVHVSDAGVLTSTWKPWPDVTVTTWLIPPADDATPYHTRVHRIASARALRFSAAGFALYSQTGSPGSERPLPAVASAAAAAAEHGRFADSRGALATSRAGVSGVFDLLGGDTPAVQDAAPSTNLVAPRTVFPTLTGAVAPGDERWVALRVFALPSSAAGEPRWAESWAALAPRSLAELGAEAGVRFSHANGKA